MEGWGQKTPKLFDIVKQSPVLKSTFGIFFRQSIRQFGRNVLSDNYEFYWYKSELKDRLELKNRTKCQRGLIFPTFKEEEGISLLVFIMERKDR